MQNAGVIAILQGEAKSGKTTFLRYALKQEDTKPCYEPTVEDKYSVAEIVRGQAVTLTYLDTGGNESCEELLPDWVSQAQFQLLFINLEQASSLEYLRLKTAVFETAKHSLIGGMLIGNLPSGNAANRKVSKQDALNLAASFSWAEFSYVELNTGTGEGVDLALSHLMESLGKSVSGAEKRSDEGKGLKHSDSFSQDVQAWLELLCLSKEGLEVMRALSSWEELKAMFDSDVAIVKTELHDYGLRKASDRNKLIAGWRTRQSRSQQHEHERWAFLEAQRQQQEVQLRATQARLEAVEAQLKVANARLEVLEGQQSEASWTHRIQEVMLKQLQAIGLARKEGPPDLTIPSKPRSPSPEETTPVKGKTVQVRVGRPKPPPGRGGLFSTSVK